MICGHGLQGAFYIRRDSVIVDTMDWTMPRRPWILATM